MQFKHLLLTGIAGASLVTLGDPALAQTPSPVATAVAATGTDTAIEEIVVTSEKRSENVQDVPVAISAFSANDLAKSDITSAIQLNQLVAGLNVGLAAGGVLTPFLRGIGNNTVVVGNEASTAVYVDDVYVPRLSASFFELEDISRVEVLEGPQGTLFGRNASGGLIDVITKAPSLDDYELEATAGYANYDTTSQKLYISAPLTDTIAANLSIYHSNQGQGWGRNLSTGQPAYYDDPTIIRSKWLIGLSDDLKVTAAFDYFHDKNNIGEPATSIPVTGIPQFYTLPPYNLADRGYGNPGYYNQDNYYDNRDREEGFGGYARIDYDLHFAKFSSISSLRQQDQDVYSDCCYVPLNALLYVQLERTRTGTQEFQIASEKDSPFDWIFGVYYLNEYAAYDPAAISGNGVAEQILGGGFGPTLPAGSTVNLFGAQRVEDYAAYGQATFHAGNNTNVTLGGRYTYDHVEGSGSTSIDIPGLFSGQVGHASDSTNFYKPTYKVAVDHHFTDDLMSYVSVSRGFKAGTYNTLPLTIPAVKPEVVDAYELGAKSTWFDHTLQLNGAFFYYDITNPQDQEIVNHTVVLTNANSAEVKGVDLDGQYAITRDLVARFGAEYLDAHYTSFPNAPYYAPVTTPPYGSLAYAGNASGNDLVDAPRFTFNVGLNYALATTIGNFNLNTNVSYNSGFKWNADNYLAQRSYELVDASLTYTPQDYDNWTARLWGKNITGTKYESFVLEQSGPTGYSYSAAAPATFGVELTYFLSVPRNAAAEAPASAPLPTATPAPGSAAQPEAQREFQVFFDFDRSSITDAAARVIQSAADVVKAGGVAHITVTGHTDTVGTARYNQGLSERRAVSVKSALITDGVPGGEITTVGVGKSGLLVPTKDGVREPQNRRAVVELQ